MAQKTTLDEESTNKVKDSEHSMTNCFPSRNNSNVQTNWSARKLIEFLQTYLTSDRSFESTKVRLGIHGDIEIRLNWKDIDIRAIWGKQEMDGLFCQPAGNGFLTITKLDGIGESKVPHLANRFGQILARRLDRLLKGQPPNLLLWKKKNLSPYIGMPSFFSSFARI